MLALATPYLSPLVSCALQIGGVCLMNEQYKMADWLNKRGAPLPALDHLFNMLSLAIFALCCTCTQVACWVSWLR